MNTGSMKLDPDVSSGYQAQSPYERLSERVFDWIADQIVRDELAPGQLVSEGEISRIIGVSRSPVREAIHQLAAEGLFKVLPRRGVVLRDLDPGHAEDIYQSRALVDGQMVLLATHEADRADVAYLSVICEDMARALHDEVAYYQGTEAFWKKIRQLSPNPVLADVSALLWRRSIPYRGFILRVPQIMEDVQRGHVKIVNAMAAQDPDAAKLHTEELLLVRSGVKLLRNGFLVYRADMG